MNNKTIKIVGNSFIFAGKKYHCAVGKNGFCLDKVEGDGCSPIGTFPLRECWYRADKMPAPITNLPLKIISENDGWCDDIRAPDYNKHIKLPHDFFHEKLWCNKAGFIYDLIIPIGYNDEDIIVGKGSAIFLHIAQPDYAGTQGCIALAKSDLLELLPNFSPQTYIEICG
jgi:L,D-peptidoglycan transpeptidase YkuD (ErfK/YbiS/YcfS/YnhG family)